MDDLAGMLSQVLSNGEAMQQIRAAASALGLDGAGAPPPQGAQSAPPQDAPASGAALDPATLRILQQAAGVFSQNDPNTDLLRALKPHFSPERAARVDDAVRILQLMRLLPLLSANGFFKGGSGG